MRQASEEFKQLIGDVIEVGTIWSCTTYGFCQELCLVFIEHVPKIIEMRRPDILYWIAAHGPLTFATRKVATALLEVMKQAGLNFSIIGNDVLCYGDSARRLGQGSTLLFKEKMSY